MPGTAHGPRVSAAENPPPKRPKPAFALFIGLLMVAVPTLVALASLDAARRTAGAHGVGYEFALAGNAHSLLRSVLVATLVAVWYGALPDEPRLGLVIASACPPGVLVAVVFASSVGTVDGAAAVTVFVALLVATGLGVRVGAAGVRDRGWSGVALALLVFAAVSFFGDLATAAQTGGTSGGQLVGDVLAAVLAAAAGVGTGQWRLRRNVAVVTRAQDLRIALAPAVLSLVVLVLTVAGLGPVHGTAFAAAGAAWLIAPLLWLGLALGQALVGLVMVAARRR